jgi:hypothetical protein
LKGCDINKTLSLRVLASAYELQQRYIRAKQQAGPNNVRRVTKPVIRHTRFRRHHISLHTCGKNFNSYLLEKKVYVSGLSRAGKCGNSSAKATKIPVTELVKREVRDFVAADAQGRNE